MAASFIQVAPDSTGKKMQTWDNLIAGSQVHAEGVVLVDQNGVPLVTLPTSGVGAANLVTSQVTSTGTAATLAIARPTRRSVLFTNVSTVGSVRIGPATVTAGNGQILGPGQSCPFSWIGLFQVIDDGANHCVICVSDEYD